MLSLRQTDQALADRLGALAAHVVEQALASGLTWDQAIVAFGVAAQAIAAKASEQGGGTPAQYMARAEQRLKTGMDQGSDILKTYLS
jgi:hypothetical protein